jgi:long-chain acyl-CoA synthetase
MNKLLYSDILQNSLIKYAAYPCLHIKRNGAYESWTYGEFHIDLNKLCSLLKRQGLRKGTNAVVIGENTPEWTIAYHAILLTGACTVPIDPNIPPSEIESILEATETKIVFCSKTYLNLFRSLKSKFSFLEKIILLDNDTSEKEPGFQQYLKNGNEDRDAFYVEFSPDDPMVIIFTSGTTGKAKGVVLCQKNYTVVSRCGIERLKKTSDDVVCAVLPLHHVFGFAACIAGPLSVGMQIVFVPFMKGPLILEALKDKGVTMLPAVPKMLSLFYETIIHNVKKKGPVVSTIFSGLKTLSVTGGELLGPGFKRTLFSSVHKGFGGHLRTIISGGAALNKKYWSGFRMLGFDIAEGYGLSETFGPITICPVEDSRVSSVGPVMDENEIKISEPNESGIGEVLLRGTCVFKGYYKNDTITKEVFDDEGWFHSGDLGYLDKDNYLYLVGRKKDMIVLATGKNVYPDELEEHYGTSSLIEEIGVFGINSGDDGEIVAAAIVPKDEIRKSNSVQKASELIHLELVRLGKELPVHRKISDYIVVFNPLPRTTTKKLKKQELKKLYTSIKRKTGNKATIEDQLSVLEIALMETVEYKSVIRSILTVAKVEEQIINPRSNLEIDLGLDSLNRIEILSLIEKQHKINLPDDIIDKLETISDLVSIVREKLLNNNSPIDKIIGLRDRIFSQSTDYIKYPKSSIVNKSVSPFVSLVTETFFKPNYINLHNIDKITEPVIFASNHCQIYDAFWIYTALSNHLKENTYFLHEKEMAQLSSLPYKFLSDHILSLNREGDPIETLKVALSVLKSNKNLIMFPEGSISKGNHPGKFKSGVGLLAKETRVKVVPVSIKCKNKTRQVIISFGSPFTFDDLIINGVLSVKSGHEDIVQYIRSTISGL